MSSVVCGFGVRKDYKGQDGWDEIYKDVELKKKLVPPLCIIWPGIFNL